ncbi:MAG: DUF481 domain-containing protein [Planctomycetota bacterium]
MNLDLLLVLPTVFPGPALPAAPAPAFGAPLPPTILSGIAQDLDEALTPTEVDPEGEVPEEPEWDGSIFAGATFADGNTETTSASLTFDAELRREKDRTTLNAFWNYADQTDTATNVSSIVERNVGGRAQYDYYFEEDLYGYTNAVFLSDTQKDLDLRLTLGVGLGYQWFEREELDFSVEAGLAYVDEDFEVDEFDEDYVAGRVAWNLFAQLTETTSFDQTLEATMSLENADDLIVRKTSNLKVLISETLTATLQYIVDYDNTPVSGNERVDQRVAVGVTWSF